MLPTSYLDKANSFEKNLEILASDNFASPADKINESFSAFKRKSLIEISTVLSLAILVGTIASKIFPTLLVLPYISTVLCIGIGLIYLDVGSYLKTRQDFIEKIEEAKKSISEVFDNIIENLKLRQQLEDHLTTYLCLRHLKLRSDDPIVPGFLLKQMNDPEYLSMQEDHVRVKTESHIKEVLDPFFDLQDEKEKKFQIQVKEVLEKLNHKGFNIGSYAEDRKKFQEWATVISKKTYSILFPTNCNDLQSTCRQFIQPIKFRLHITKVGDFSFYEAKTPYRSNE